MHVVDTKSKFTVDEPDVVTSIRLTREQHDALKARARADTRTLSQQMRVVVDWYLSQPTPERNAA